MTIADTLKRFFSRSEPETTLTTTADEDADIMWQNLSYTGPAEFHPSLDMDGAKMMSMDKKERDEYINDLIRRRNKAHYENL